MTVPTSESATAATVAANAQTFAAKSPADVTTSLASNGAGSVSISSVSPTVAQTRQTVAIVVAPPPPSPPPPSPPPTPPPPSPPVPSAPAGGKSSDNTGAIVGGVVGGICGPLFGAIGYYVWKKNKMQQVKPVTSDC